MKHSIRNWHTWVSLALGLPLLLVGLTTVFIAHDKALGTRDVLLPAGWGGAPARMREIRAVLEDDARHWLGTTDGVFRLENGVAVALEGGPEDEIRALAAAGDAVLMAGKRGLWRYADGAAEQVHRGDCWQVVAGAGGYAAACKDAGLLSSGDGIAWQPRAVDFAAGAPPATGLSLQKLIMDIHTGKLFFGKNAEWIWIDLVGLSTVGLALTGFVMWMRGRRARAATGNT